MIKIKNKKIILSSLMILMIMVLVSGCFGGDPTDEVNEDILWDNYSNDYAEFKYPDEWEKSYDEISDINDDGIDDRFTVSYVDSLDNSKMEIGLNLSLTEEGQLDDSIPNLDTKEDFYNYVEDAINEMPAEFNLIKQEKITVNDNPSYRIIYTTTNSNDEEIKSDGLMVFKNNLIHQFVYTSRSADYNSSLWEEVYNSLEFKF